MPSLTIEPTRHARHGPCAHCGGDTQTMLGRANAADGHVRASYMIRWTAGRPRDGAVWLVSVGRPDLDPSDARLSVGIRMRPVWGRPQFMVVDVAETPWKDVDSPSLAANCTRTQVIGTPLATRAFDVVDVVLAQDPRVIRFLRTGEGVEGQGAPVPLGRWLRALPRTLARRVVDRRATRAS
jgi:hypothetical protein